MSGGKYTLELDDLAKGNAQAGLGIKISDAWSGQSRDPRSLSGGETFYAALALALGLADVVRDEAGGTQLETLFVDEGFGSLDQESLQLVLEQLDALRSGGRIVGVVSHVTEMKDWVQHRVEVEVSPDRTSRVRTLL
jgi:exonuclease SbcC